MEIVGEAGILIQADTGRILLAKNEHKKMYPASTTKIWTAINALERGNLTDIVTVGKNATLVDGSKVYLNEGEQYTLEELLYALMLESANDAAVAIAEHIAGSVEEFAKLSNQKAAEIGCQETHFTNPNGLPDPEHYTSAYDMALMARYAMQNEDFRKIVSTKSKIISYPVKEDENRPLHNGNRLLREYPGADGIKTGYTVAAGQCLVGSATRDGQRLIAVVFKSQGKNIWTDVTGLLDYGFANFQMESVMSKDKPIAELPVKFGDSVQAIAENDFSYPLLKDGSEQIETVVKWNNPELKAPLEKGEPIGKLIFTLKGEEIGSVNIVAQNDVERRLVTFWWFWLALFGVLFLALFIIGRTVRRIRRKKARRAALRRKYMYYNSYNP
ncbi:MAG TPA: D-alanyl-D-alanine carboxypeptidase [Clostridia bacterium]|nr:D-alanyl-D-alanine carboxypeptidase [Clostridia bacterium]